MSSKAPITLTLKSYTAAAASQFAVEAIRAGYRRGWEDAIEAAQPAILRMVRERELALTKRCEAIIEVVLAATRTEIEKAQAAVAERPVAPDVGIAIDNAVALLAALVERVGDLASREMPAPVVNVENVIPPATPRRVTVTRRDGFGGLKEAVVESA